MQQDYLLYLQLGPLDKDYFTLAAEFSAHQIFLLPVSLNSFLNLHDSPMGVVALIQNLSALQTWQQHAALILRAINGQQHALWTLSSFRINTAQRGFNLPLPSNLKWDVAAIGHAYQEFKQKMAVNQWPWGRKAHLPMDI
ncbi:MAG: hypothetical protein J6Y94_04725 [Bacteriovoracaceae bacterium]|nr:hypothetical protein [Bacteriovoracaceae bacterium]